MRGNAISDDYSWLLASVQRGRRWNHAVDNAAPPFRDERSRCLDDVVQLPASILQLINELAEQRARCFELHVLAEIPNRSACNHVAVQDESLDPRTVYLFRMDLHNRHGLAPIAVKCGQRSWRQVGANHFDHSSPPGRGRAPAR